MKERNAFLGFVPMFKDVFVKSVFLRFENQERSETVTWN